MSSSRIPYLCHMSKKSPPASTSGCMSFAVFLIPFEPNVSLTFLITFRRINDMPIDCHLESDDFSSTRILLNLAQKQRTVQLRLADGNALKITTCPCYPVIPRAPQPH